MTTVLIVDDNADFRAMARVLLESTGFDVVGEAPDGEAGIQSAIELRPEVVVLDVQLPGKDGFEVARDLQSLAGAPRVVLVSSRRASDYGPRLSEPGVHGFIPKDDLDGSALGALLT